MFKKNILITGSAGYIGKNLINLLINNGYNISQIDLKHNKNLLFDTLRDRPGNYNFIIHLAATSGVQDCDTNKKQATINNLFAPIQLLYDANKYNIPVIVFSSGAAEFPEANYYARMKSMLEQYTLLMNSYPYNNLSSKNMNLIFRPTNVYGGIDYIKDKNSVIAKFIKNKNTKIKIYGDGNQLRDFIHVDDICDVMLYTIRHYHELNKNLFNVPIPLCTGVGTTINDLCEMCNISNYEYIDDKNKRGIVKSVGDPTLITKYLGFKYDKDKLSNYLKNYV